MTSPAISTLKCPIDGTALEASLFEQGESRWVCPRCEGHWTESDVIRRGRRIVTKTADRMVGSASSVNRRSAGASSRRGATFQPFRTDAVAAESASAIDRLVANRTPVAAMRVPAADEWTLADIDLAQGRTSGAPIELFYDEIAEDFDQIMNIYDLQRRVETVFDVLLKDYDLTNRTLLDAGCGTGWFSLAACRRGAKVTALDIGPRLLEQVRRKCEARIICGDVLHLDFEDGAFDVVVSSECIEHTRNPRRAVQELVRVCKPGGLIAITTPNHFWYWLCAVANKLHLRPYEGIEDWPRWTDFRKWVEEAGGQTLDMRGIHLFPFQLSIFHPLLKFLDRFGRFHGRFCVNQAILAKKPC